MDILAPVNAAAEVDPLLDCGATELYCGFMPLEQLERYTTAAWMNRRGFRANVHTEEELSQIVERAHVRHVPVFLTLNAPYYTQDQYDDVFFVVDVATKAAIDGIIVADLGILLALREAGVELELCLSTVGDCYNSQTARFFQELGISRIILPRHLTFAEIERLINRSEGVRFEAFIMHSRCVYEDGLCLTAHGVLDLPNFCCGPQEYSAFTIDGQELGTGEVERITGNAQAYRQWCFISQHPFHSPCSQGSACGLCAIPHLAQLGVSAVKVVGRGKPIELKLRLVKAVSQVVAGLKAGLSPKALKYKSVELMGNHAICQRGFACYYREANPFMS